MHIKLVILLKFDYQISEFGPRQQDHVATQIYQTLTMRTCPPAQDQ
jgi:hypothetical protein